MASNSSKDNEGKDRRLGDEWSDWDGNSVAETRAGKRLFISLSIAILVVFAGLLGFAWYLVAPRLAQWHALAPTAFLALCGLGVVVLGLELCTVTLSLWTGWPLPRPLTAVTRWLLIVIERRVFALGRRLAIDRDRKMDIDFGVTAEQDTLPRRFTQEPLKEGASKGQIVPIERMVKAYYKARGWNAQGVPQG